VRRRADAGHDGRAGGLLFGYDLGVVAGALLYIKPEFGLTAAGEGFVTSLLLLGMAACLVLLA
jgi:major inositol transporter-like SP family MFS transporter